LQMYCALTYRIGMEMYLNDEVPFSIIIVIPLL
jgi:hypothetical protein